MGIEDSATVYKYKQAITVCTDAGAVGCLEYKQSNLKETSGIKKKKKVLSRRQCLNPAIDESKHIWALNQRAHIYLDYKKGQNVWDI